MTNFLRASIVALAATAASVSSFSSAHAGASERMKTACTSDYLNFCSQYDPDSFQTVNCMKKNQKRISKACRQVVEEEGIPSGGAKKRVASKR